jgi:hypothetical protein
MMLKPLIGLDDNAKPALFVTPFAISKLSPAHLRGKPLPADVQKFLETGEEPLAAVAAMQKYYNDSNNIKKRK